MAAVSGKALAVRYGACRRRRAWQCPQLEFSRPGRPESQARTSIAVAPDEHARARALRRMMPARRVRSPTLKSCMRRDRSPRRRLSGPIARVAASLEMPCTRARQLCREHRPLGMHALCLFMNTNPTRERLTCSPSRCRDQMASAPLHCSMHQLATSSHTPFISDHAWQE